MNKSNNYWVNSLLFQEKLLTYVQDIFDKSNWELELKLNDFNLLGKQSIIESSTVIGYCIEEYLTKKLNDYTINKEIKIQRLIESNKYSYDCLYENDSDVFLINIKLEKKNNNAIAAISQLISDYEYWINKNKQVHFMVLKINYSFNKDSENRKIVINELKSFYLEEINFANGHLQDHRNWSSNYNANSGRLIISPSFYNKNKNKDSEISYIKTFKELKQLN
ncbi:hypothetical protein RNN91_01480 [Mycoplasmopsis felis]|uniref:UpaP162 family type II restriction enzyme n=1 Tax=Mycoplasmopsis felis TaxID=33923 RepID=UPI002AF6C92B|nr:hypothetical protein [Mycoplasmopsis felis]WQQ01512.1 hypothetical protein RRG54_02895 [Mycoplasmopsis felis]